jgi:hypothetical protein
LLRAFRLIDAGQPEPFGRACQALPA